MVAEEGFEPPTSGLCARRATGLLYSAILYFDCPTIIAQPCIIVKHYFYFISLPQYHLAIYGKIIRSVRLFQKISYFSNFSPSRNVFLVVPNKPSQYPTKPLAYLCRFPYNSVNKQSKTFAYICVFHISDGHLPVPPITGGCPSVYAKISWIGSIPNIHSPRMQQVSGDCISLSCPQGKPPHHTAVGSGALFRVAFCSRAFESINFRRFS